MNCWAANSDGAGFMYVKDGKVIVSKGYMKFKHLSRAYADVPDDSPLVVHFRIRTHGLTDQANTHPFVVTEGKLAIAHNGILPIDPPAGSTQSDTAFFVDAVLKGLPRGWHTNDAMLYLLEEYCGSHNKMAIMDHTGKVTLINEAAGTWEEGVWFSNQSFRGYRSYANYKYQAPGNPLWNRDDRDEWDTPYLVPEQSSVFPLDSTPIGGDQFDASKKYHDPYVTLGVGKDPGLVVNEAIRREHSVRRDAKGTVAEVDESPRIIYPTRPRIQQNADIGDIDDEERFLESQRAKYVDTRPYLPYGFSEHTPPKKKG